jgi:light-regulated signal transduction histidine kinase (bacteriophytochrome)
VDTLLKVRGNRVHLTQVFQNLISNAVKYRGQTEPQVTVRAEKDLTGWMFSVEDNGMGIHRDYHEMVFHPFKRLHGQDSPFAAALSSGMAAASGWNPNQAREPRSGSAISASLSSWVCDRLVRTGRLRA